MRIVLYSSSRSVNNALGTSTAPKYLHKRPNCQPPKAKILLNDPKTSGWAARFLEAWAAFDAIRGRRTTGREFAGALGDWPESTFSELKEADDAPTHARILQVAAASGMNPGYLAYSVGPKVLRDAATSAEDAPGAAKQAHRTPDDLPPVQNIPAAATAPAKKPKRVAK